MKAFALTAGLIVVACSGSTEPPLACTLIGCDSGIEVRLDAAPPLPYTVTARAVASGAQMAVECTVAQPCPRIFFTDFTPAQVRIELSSAQGIRTVTATPEYTVSQPNGPRCPPTCRNAVVVVPAS